MTDTSRKGEATTGDEEKQVQSWSPGLGPSRTFTDEENLGFTRVLSQLKLPLLMEDTWAAGGATPSRPLSAPCGSGIHLPQWRLSFLLISVHLTPSTKRHSRVFLFRFS